MTVFTGQGFNLLLIPGSILEFQGERETKIRSLQYNEIN